MVGTLEKGLLLMAPITTLTQDGYCDSPVSRSVICVVPVVPRASCLPLAYRQSDKAQGQDAPLRLTRQLIRE